MCERMNGICPEGYRRYRIDDHIYNIFNLLSVLGHNRILYLPDVVFEHHNFVTTTAGDVEYQPDPAIHAIDTELFDSLLEDRKRIAVDWLAILMPAATVKWRRFGPTSWHRSATPFHCGGRSMCGRGKSASRQAASRTRYGWCSLPRMSGRRTLRRALPQ